MWFTHSAWLRGVAYRNESSDVHAPWIFSWIWNEFNVTLPFTAAIWSLVVLVDKLPRALSAEAWFSDRDSSIGASGLWFTTGGDWFLMFLWSRIGIAQNWMLWVLQMAQNWPNLSTSKWPNGSIGTPYFHQSPVTSHNFLSTISFHH